jgi:hypothetical protein
LIGLTILTVASAATVLVRDENERGRFVRYLFKAKITLLLLASSRRDELARALTPRSMWNMP